MNTTHEIQQPFTFTRAEILLLKEALSGYRAQRPPRPQDHPMSGFLKSLTGEEEGTKTVEDSTAAWDKQRDEAILLFAKLIQYERSLAPSGTVQE